MGEMGTAYDLYPSFFKNILVHPTTKTTGDNSGTSSELTCNSVTKVGYVYGAGRAAHKRFSHFRSINCLGCWAEGGEGF